jgi:hypothetical protein
MTIAEMILQLEKMPDKSLPVYFDCWHCGAAQGFKELSIVAVVKTVGFVTKAGGVAATTEAPE